MAAGSCRHRKKHDPLLSMLQSICNQKLLCMHGVIQWKPFEFQIHSSKNSAAVTQAHSSDMEFGDRWPRQICRRLHETGQKLLHP